MPWARARGGSVAGAGALAVNGDVTLRQRERGSCRPYGAFVRVRKGHAFLQADQTLLPAFGLGERGAGWISAPTGHTVEHPCVPWPCKCTPALLENWLEKGAK